VNAHYFEKLNPEAMALRNELLKRLRGRGPQPEPSVFSGAKIDSPNDILAVIKYMQTLVDSLGGG
jgi:hypothetical protein